MTIQKSVTKPKDEKWFINSQEYRDLKKKKKKRKKDKTPCSLCRNWDN